MYAYDNPVLGACRPRQGFSVFCLIVSAVLCLNSAHAREFTLAPEQAAIGAISTYITSAEETLMDVARAHNVGYTELMAVNRDVSAWSPGNGSVVVIPGLHLLPDAPRTGIVLNLAARRLYYYPLNSDRVETYPVAIGTMQSTTPLGEAKIVRGTANPTWYPPASIRAKDPTLRGAVPPGRDNPLGKYAFYLNWPEYLIHGTNQPDGIGRAVSHGCVQLYPEDIERLSKVVPIGTPVRIINEYITLAMVDGDLYLEVHPSRMQAEAIEINAPTEPEPPAGLKERVTEVATQYGVKVDWDAVEMAGLERNGVPVVIGHGQSSLQSLLVDNDAAKLYPADLYLLP